MYARIVLALFACFLLGLGLAQHAQIASGLTAPLEAQSGHETTYTLAPADLEPGAEQPQLLIVNGAAQPTVMAVVQPPAYAASALLDPCPDALLRPPSRA